MPLQKAKLIDKASLTSDVVELSFETQTQFSFQAGQFISIKIEDNPASPCIRGYSIASSPNPDSPNHFNLCIKLIENGRGTTWLNSLKINDEISFLGPNGKFIFNENSQGTSLFIGTGTGVAPLKAMIEDQLLNKNNGNKLHLLFGVRYINGIFYENLFKSLSEKFSNFTYDIIVSRPENPDWKGNPGRVTALLNPLKIDTTNTEVYLCGLKDMLTEVTSILESKGLASERIHKEQYD